MLDQNSEMMVKVYSKLADCLAVGANSPVPGHNFLVLENPGILIRPTLDMTKVDDQFVLGKEFSKTCYPTWIWEDSGISVESVFGRVLTDKELPLVTLSASQQQQLDDAKAFLHGPLGKKSREYQLYKQYESDYNDARDALDNARMDSRNHGTPLPQHFLTDESDAMNDWVSFGYKMEVEEAQAIIYNLQAFDPNAWWNTMATSFRQLTLTNSAGEHFMLTDTSPTYADVVSGSGWTKFTFSDQDYNNQSVSTSTSIGGGLSVNFGLWRASASASYTKDTGYSHSSGSSVIIEAKFLRLDLIRDWLEPLVFATRAWRWKMGSPSSSTVISNGGDIAHGQTPQGTMPFLPTGILLAKDVKITTAFSEEEQRHISESFSSGGSIGWGPFSFGGHYSRSSTEDYSSGRISGNTISTPDIQILGRFCSVLSQCPNPDPALTWPSPLLLDHYPEHSPQFIKLIRSRRPYAKLKYGVPTPPPPPVSEEKAAPPAERKWERVAVGIGIDGGSVNEE